MKKLLASILALALICCFWSFSASATFDRSYVAPKGTATVNGTGNDSVWEKATWVLVDKPFDGVADTDAAMRVKLAWDDDCLYMLAEVYDKTLSITNTTSPDGVDAVELYLDMLNDKTDFYNTDDSQTRFLLTGSLITGAHAGTNARSNASCVSLAPVNNSYLLEIAVPWGTEVELGKVIGLEMMYNDAANNTFAEALRWNADTANGDTPPWQGTSAWGTLTLGDEAGNAPTTTTTQTTTTTTQAAPSVTAGDVNSDTKVNTRDVAALQQYISQWNVTINPLAADVNADGKINTRDVALLQQYISQWNVTLQVPGAAPTISTSATTVTTTTSTEATTTTSTVPGVTTTTTEDEYTDIYNPTYSEDYGTTTTTA